MRTANDSNIAAIAASRFSGVGLSLLCGGILAFVGIACDDGDSKPACSAVQDASSEDDADVQQAQAAENRAALDGSVNESKTPDAGRDTDADSARDAASPETAKEMKPAVNEPVSLVQAQHLRGAMWTSGFATETGVDAYSVSGAAWRAVTSALDAMRPSPDGKFYAYVVHGTNSSGADVSEVGVVDAQSLDTRNKMMLTGYAYFPRIAPHDPDQVVVYWSASAASDESVEARFLDIAAGSELWRTQIVGNLDWMPNGDYLRVTGDGAIYLGKQQGKELMLGSIALPLDTFAGSVRVDHAGKRLLLSVSKRSGQSYDRDLYVANIDGSAFERFTKTTRSNYGEWSPDDRYIAFNHDPDLDNCGGIGFCLHSDCRILYAPAAARNITVNGSKSDPLRPIALSAKGAAVYVGCRLLGWVDEPQ